MKVDSDAALKYANAALTAAKGGTSLDIKDGNAIPKYMFSILSIGVGLIPGVGPLFGTLVGLIGEVAFPKTTDPKAVWNSLRENVES